MKKWMIWILCAALALTACGPAPEQTLPQESTAPTAPQTTAPPSLLEQGMSWNDDTSVLELPLKLPECSGDLQMSSFGGQLLLWQTEYEGDNVAGMRLWLMELEYGTILAEQWVETQTWIQPQIQQNRICLCSGETGVVTVLNEALEIEDQWTLEPDWGYWIMGYGTRQYRFQDNVISEQDLQTGQQRIVLDGVTGVYSSQLREDGAEIWFTEAGTQKIGYLDFATGSVEHQPFRGLFDDVDVLGELWLCRKYVGGGEYRLGSEAEAWDLKVPSGLVNLTKPGLLLTDGDNLCLYDRQGKAVGDCSVMKEGYRVNTFEPVWADGLNGFLMLATDWEYTQAKLLLWIPGDGGSYEDLTMEPVDLSLTQEQELQQLQVRADAIGQEYGLRILIGRACQTEFADFTAAYLTEPDMVKLQLDYLETALGAYPEGFIRQLNYENYEYIEIQLVSGLNARPHYGNGAGYVGFVQPQEDYYLMVIDGCYSAEGTYYHEFSHIIDSYLSWECWQREDALFSFEGWEALNPPDFCYTWDYAAEQELTEAWEPYFIDSYSTINTTEDMARIMEYGMMAHCDWLFEAKPGAREKLRWYAMCIRDAFDTTGWPEELLWEQYLED